ncbi:MAG: hypothetical protein QM679_08935 [Patulibacter sp.]
MLATTSGVRPGPDHRVPDRCPTTTELHRAADGLIMRLRLPGGRLAAAAAHALAGAAAAGETIELTSRANLQLRALDDTGAQHAAAVATAAALVPSAAHERARTIVTSPLIGRRPGATPGIDDQLVADLDHAIRARTDTTCCSGRILTAIDDGTGGTMLAVAPDLLLLGEPATGQVRLLLAGTYDAGSTGPATAPGRAAALLGALAQTTRAAGVWRAHELDDATLAAVIAAAEAPPPPAPGDHALGSPTATTAPLPIGVIAQANAPRAAVRAATPLGRLTPQQLAAVATLAATHHTDLRIDAGRGVTLVDLPDTATATATLAELAQLGLIATPDDPALGLTACAGISCTRTNVDVRGAAHLRRATRRHGDPHEHLAGCERRCGAPAPAPAPAAPTNPTARTVTTATTAMTGAVVVVAIPGDTPATLAARAAQACATHTPDRPKGTR